MRRRTKQTAQSRHKTAHARHPPPQSPAARPKRSQSPTKVPPNTTQPPQNAPHTTHTTPHPQPQHEHRQTDSTTTSAPLLPRSPSTPKPQNCTDARARVHTRSTHQTAHNPSRRNTSTPRPTVAPRDSSKQARNAPHPAPPRTPATRNINQRRVTATALRLTVPHSDH